VLSQYNCIIFDCDGVILNSNPIKKQAFYKAVISYGQDAADQLVAYNIKYGGKSRYEKFEYFIYNIIGRKPKPGEIRNLLQTFAKEVKKNLMQCEVATGLIALREATSKSRWLIVSGSDQAELREVFHKLSIDEYFDAGIFGSPDNKDEILNRELNNGNVRKPAVFLGDSYYDYEAANRAGLNFIFIAGWSEFEKGRIYFNSRDVLVVDSIADLMKYLTTR